MRPRGQPAPEARAAVEISEEPSPEPQPGAESEAEGPGEAAEAAVAAVPAPSAAPVFSRDYLRSVAGLLSAPLREDFRLDLGGAYIRSLSLEIWPFGLLRPLIGANLDRDRVRLVLRGADGSAGMVINEGETLSLKEGDYSLLASFIDDIGTGKIFSLHVAKGSSQELVIEELQYSLAYRQKALEADRDREILGYEAARAGLEKDVRQDRNLKKSLYIAGWTSLGVGAASLAGTAVSYILGSIAAADYRNAGTSALAVDFRQRTDRYSLSFSVSLGLGIGFLALSPLCLGLRPDPDRLMPRIADLELAHAERISVLDADIAALAQEKIQ